MQQRCSIRHGSPRHPHHHLWPSASISLTNNKRSGRTSMSSSQTKTNPSASLVKCTRATTTLKSKRPIMKCRQTSTRPGSIPYSFSSNVLPNARHMETTAWQIAALTVRCTSTTSQPIAAMSLPPVTSPPAISTLRALRNHFRQHGSPDPADLLCTELDAQRKQFD